MTWGELLVIVTGKAEAFIYKSPSYNNARRCNMLGGKLSQLNDKVQEQKVQKKETMMNQQVSQAVMSESEVIKNRMWFVMMAKKAIGYVM